ncbi:DUF397 domain-containing protein [Streptomyces shaanxiensis]
MRGPLVWRKSSHSSSGATCIEVACALPVVLVRDSKDVTKSPLRIHAQGWDHFRAAICTGDLFRPH